MVVNGGLIVFDGDLPSGKFLHNELERSTMFNGKINYLTMAMFNSYFDITRG